MTVRKPMEYFQIIWLVDQFVKSIKFTTLIPSKHMSTLILGKLDQDLVKSRNWQSEEFWNDSNHEVTVHFTISKKASYIRGKRV